MKVTVIDPTTNNRLGLARLKRDVAPLLRLGWPGTRHGQPVIRTFNYTAADTRATLDGLVQFVDNTGYILRVEATQQERRAFRLPAGRSSFHYGTLFYIRPRGG